MIKNIIFDLGGVIITLDQSQAVRRFEALGIADARQHLDTFTQKGIFGQLENGLISAEQFRAQLSQMAGRELTAEQCAYAWQGYALEVPQRNLDTLKLLRQQGYRLLLLSNTNPYMMQWVESPDFDGNGHPVSAYFDTCYLSYEMKLMKPCEEIFRQVILREHIIPNETLFVDDGPRNVAMGSQVGMHTLCPENGGDWTSDIFDIINKQKAL